MGEGISANQVLPGLLPVFKLVVAAVRALFSYFTKYPDADKGSSTSKVVSVIAIEKTEGSNPGTTHEAGTLITTGRMDGKLNGSNSQVGLCWTLCP